MNQIHIFYYVHKYLCVSYVNRCNACQQIDPFVLELASHCPNVVFVKVDIDVCADIASERRIKALPTFHLYKNGELVELMVGVNEQRLKSLIIQSNGESGSGVPPKITPPSTAINTTGTTAIAVAETKEEVVTVTARTESNGQQQEHTDLSCVDIEKYLGRVTAIDSNDLLKALIRAPQLTVVDFTAKWFVRLYLNSFIIL